MTPATRGAAEDPGPSASSRGRIGGTFLRTGRELGVTFDPDTLTAAI